VAQGKDRDIQERLETGGVIEAFEMLLDRYQNKVFRLCWSMLADEALAEDVTQEVFLRVWKALRNYRGLSSISTWLYAVTRNTCLTKLKHQESRATVLLREAQLRDGATLPHSGELDISSLLTRLPEKYRQVVLLFYFEDKSYDEVATMLGLPVGTVKTHLHRAKKELCSAMEAEYGVQRA
jgi:RNA polymerase sigma-70 factor (ECF subfamily)